MGVVEVRMSQIWAPTLREVPADAEIPSHQLMLRAGLIRKSVSGIYTYLPLGYRVIRKVEQIIREEMDRQGGQEILMPAVQSADLWRETGRWDDYGSEMFKLTDRAGRGLCLGPTHEELVTASVRDEMRSYRQLPTLLYQIQTKFRDEIRPRFGLMRAREFVMKDLYSFDKDLEGLDISYRKMYEAYCRVFDRCGLIYKIVEADCGTIGGTSSHEYMVISEIGEAAIVYCDKCDYAANVERAEVVYKPCGCECDSDTPALEKIPTPHVRTIEELTEFLNVESSKMLKTLVYVADGTPVVAIVRGDRTLNEVKLKKVVGCKELELASEEVIEKVTGAPVGFAGPVGLKGVRVIADLEIPDVKCGITGGNEKDVHYKNVMYKRDYEVSEVADLRDAVAGDMCPVCGAPMCEARGVEVGHLFKLGTKYSEPLGAKFLGEDGIERPVIMGCYGIGVTRVVAAVIEAGHDDNGIIWPMSIAPYHVTIVVVNSSDEKQSKVGEDIYEELSKRGVECILDDRNERTGVKFKDADLIGIPIRITAGRTVDEGMVEIKHRKSSQATKVPIEQVAETVQKMIADEMASLTYKGTVMK